MFNRLFHPSVGKVLLDPKLKIALGTPKMKPKSPKSKGRQLQAWPPKVISLECWFSSLWMWACAISVNSHWMLGICYVVPFLEFLINLWCCGPMLSVNSHWMLGIFNLFPIFEIVRNLMLLNCASNCYMLLPLNVEKSILFCCLLVDGWCCLLSCMSCNQNLESW